MGKKDSGSKRPTSQLLIDQFYLQTVIETIPDLVWLKDLDGKYLLCNLKFERFIGLKNSEIIGKTDFDFFPAELAKFFRQKDVEAFDARKPLTNIEWLTYVHDGHKELAETTKTPLYGSDGEILGILGIAHDITERYLADEKLKESESKYKLLFEKNPMPMWIYDFTTLCILEVNQAAINHYGYNKNEFLSMTIKDMRPSEDIKDLVNTVDKINEDLRYSGVWRHKKKNGEIINVEITSHEIDFDKRKARLVLLNDITIKKKAEDDLKTLTRSVEQSPASIIITNKEGIIEYVNPKFSSLSGYSFKESIGKNPRFLKSGTTTSDKYKELWDTITSGKTWHGEFKNIKKNGDIYFEIASISPILDDKGRITQFLGVKEDITERKKTEGNLHKFMMGIENSADAIFITDKDGTIEYINPAFENIYGFTRIEALGKTPRILKSGLIPPEGIKRFWETLLDGGIVKGEIKNKTKDGRIIDIEGSNSPILEDNGKIIGFLSINRDITDKKKSERDLIEAKEKAEQSDKLKTSFLQNISHEIRTPLNAILGFSELLQDPNISIEDSRFFIEQMHYGKDDLLEFVENVVYASKFDTKQFVSTIKEFNLNESLNDLIAASKKLIIRNEKSHLSFLYHIESTNGYIIEADENNIKMALGQILSNAIKYTEYGQIDLSTKLIGNSEIEFIIKDTGIGIDKSEHERIFDRFYKVESTSSKLFRGAGIGLTIVKGITEALAGTVKLESSSGAGSVFYLNFPVKLIGQESGKNKLQTDISIISVNWGDRNILIAEDIDNNFEYLDKALNFAGLTKFHARNGFEAIEIFQKIKIDLVLMDILMPLADGYEAAAKIKAINPHIPIIAQTAIFNITEHDFNLETLFEDYLIKPIDRNVLLRVLNKYLKR